MRQNDVGAAAAAILAVDNTHAAGFEMGLDEARKVDEHAAVARHGLVKHKGVVHKSLRVAARHARRDVDDGHFGRATVGGSGAANHLEKVRVDHVRSVAADNNGNLIPFVLSAVEHNTTAPP